MKIVICGSIDLTEKIKEAKEALEKLGHETEIPFMSQRIIAGEITLADFLAIKDKQGDAVFRQEAGVDLIKRYYELIKKSDAILVINGDKKGIANYIGGNAFLEIGFAHVLDKKIFLLNSIPDIPYYRDELMAVNPVILNNNFENLS